MPTYLRNIVQLKDEMGDEKKETYEEKKMNFGNVIEKKKIEEKVNGDD